MGTDKDDDRERERCEWGRGRGDASAVTCQRKLIRRLPVYATIRQDTAMGQGAVSARWLCQYPQASASQTMRGGGGRGSRNQPISCTTWQYNANKQATETGTSCTTGRRPCKPTNETVNWPQQSSLSAILPRLPGCLSLFPHVCVCVGVCWLGCVASTVWGLVGAISQLVAATGVRFEQCKKKTRATTTTRTARESSLKAVDTELIVQSGV